MLLKVIGLIGTTDETTKYNQHGIYPITRDQEIKIVEGISMINQIYFVNL